MESININLIPGGILPLVHVSQNDVGRQFRLNLLDGNTVYTLDGTEDVTIEIGKPDNHIVTADVTNTSDTYVVIATTDQMTACSGKCVCELRIAKSGVNIGMANFLMVVEESAISGGINSGSVIKDIGYVVEESLQSHGFPELPQVTDADDGSYLGVYDGEWTKIDLPSGTLPYVTSEDEGKALIVDDNGEWVADDIPSELPTFGSGDSGKVLTINSAASGVEWKASDNSGKAATHFGSGAPTNVIVAAQGDYYWDYTNFKLYICTQYIEPSIEITDLSGYTFLFNQSLSASDLAAYAGDYSITFKMLKYTNGSNVETNFLISTYNSNGAIKYSGGNINGWVYYNQAWSGGASTQYDKIEFVGGADATDENLIAFVTRNAVLQGVGSNWKLIRTLPEPSSLDEDKLIQHNGEWLPNSSVHTTGEVIDRLASNPTSHFNRSYPGSMYSISVNGYERIRMDASNQDIIWVTSSNNQSMRRTALKSYLSEADTGLGSKITANKNINDWSLCQPGSYGYIAANIASTLTNCPVSTPFVLISIVLNTAMYYTSPSASSLRNARIIRFILAENGDVYKQSVQVDNSSVYTYGDWCKLVTSAEIPAPPTADGNYVLKCSVSSGAVTYSWSTQ